ncbi:MAG: S1 RNA-binding domain-containing protein [Pirellulales bacterium]
MSQNSDAPRQVQLPSSSPLGRALREPADGPRPSPAVGAEPQPQPAAAAQTPAAPVAVPVQPNPPVARPARPARGPEGGNRPEGGDEEDGGDVPAAPAARVPIPPARSGPALRPNNVRLDDDELAAAMGDIQLDKLLGGKVTTLELDSRCRGTVVKIDHDSVFISLGSQHEGVASLRQFADPPSVGDPVEVVISRFLADEGLYEVTVPGAAVSVADWSDIDEGMTVEARVTGHNAGGLECEVNNLRGFIPISQVAMYRVENLEEFVGQRLACVVTEANPQRRNLVLSHRAVLEREKEASRSKLLGELAAGQIREGIIRNIRDFGAFVDLGGVDGLIHVTQLSWDRIKHPSDVVQLGQKVRVKVEKIDPTTQKISLSYRDLMDSPWSNLEAEYPVGSVVPGTVTKIMEFGAFVRIGPGIEGLVHISELAHRRVQRVGQVVKEGESVQVKILSVDRENQKVSLSLKQAQAVEGAAEGESGPEAEETPVPRAAVKGPTGPLKGGTNRRSGGDQFGLNW